VGHNRDPRLDGRAAEARCTGACAGRRSTTGCCGHDHMGRHHRDHHGGGAERTRHRGCEESLLYRDQDVGVRLRVHSPGHLTMSLWRREALVRVPRMRIPDRRSLWCRWGLSLSSMSQDCLCQCTGDVVAQALRAKALIGSSGREQCDSLPRVYWHSVGGGDLVT
jgi:hypothetical protein